MGHKLDNYGMPYPCTSQSLYLSAKSSSSLVRMSNHAAQDETQCNCAFKWLWFDGYYHAVLITQRSVMCREQLMWDYGPRAADLIGFSSSKEADAAE